MNQRNGRNGGRQGQSSNRRAKRRVPTRHRISFVRPTVPTSAVRKSIQARFDRTTDIRIASRSIKTSLNDAGQLTLRGTVTSVEAALLAGNLARLEPGVRTVQNLLTVDPKKASE